MGFFGNESAEAGHSFAFAIGALEPFANIACVHVEGRVNEFGR
jgi:uncharacterized protein with beta-barrel porin domain